jgi:uncharacterized protein (DUF433 family)
VTGDALFEAERLLRPPGITFEDGPAGRTAIIAGTQLAVWELINEYLVCGNDRTQFYETFDWLRPEQFNAAFAYYQAFPEDIDRRIRAEGKTARRYVRPGPGSGHGLIAPP